MSDAVDAGLGAAEQPVESAPIDSGSEQPAVFHEWDHPSGEKVTFSTPDELNEALKSSYFRQQDYTRKTQSIAEQKKQIEKERADFQEQMKMFQQSKKQYDEWDNLLKQRPQIYQQLQNLARSPANPGEIYDRSVGYVDEKTKAFEEKVKQFEDYIKEQKSEKERNSIIEQLTGKYEDFDRQSVEEALAALRDGGLPALYEMGYYARKGRSLTPSEVEKNVTQKLRKKQSAGLQKPGQPPSNGKQYANVKEARAAAMRDMAGLTD